MSVEKNNLTISENPWSWVNHANFTYDVQSILLSSFFIDKIKLFLSNFLHF